jgi:hypothetical protein
VEIKLEQHAASKIISIKFVPLDCKETAVLNSKLKIINGNTKTIIVFIDKLKVYKNCFMANGIAESRRIIDSIISAKINGILLNIINVLTIFLR